MSDDAAPEAETPETGNLDDLLENIAAAVEHSAEARREIRAAVLRQWAADAATSDMLRLHIAALMECLTPY